MQSGSGLRPSRCYTSVQGNLHAAFWYQEKEFGIEVEPPHPLPGRPRRSPVHQHHPGNHAATALPNQWSATSRRRQCAEGTWCQNRPSTTPGRRQRQEALPRWRQGFIKNSSWTGPSSSQKCNMCQRSPCPRLRRWGVSPHWRDPAENAKDGHAWKAPCGWLYGSTQYFRLSEPPPNPLWCKLCNREVRQQTPVDAEGPRPLRHRTVHTIVHVGRL